MRRPLLLPAVLAGMLVLAAGCDGVSTPDESVVVGRWSASATVERTFVTSTRAQTILDPSRPGEGGLTVSGSDAETLRYVGPPYVGPHGDTTWTVSSVSLSGGLDPRPSAYGFASLAPYHVGVTLWRGSTLRQYGAEAIPATAFRWDGTRLWLPVSHTLTHPEAGTVELAGSVVPATQALDGGREALVRTRTHPWDSWPTTYDFRADGTVRRALTQIETGDVYSYDGTWERLGESPLGGERIRMTFGTPGTTVETRVEARAERAGADLHLTFDERPCASVGAVCIEWRESEFGMQPGTLADLRIARVTVLVPAP